MLLTGGVCVEAKSHHVTITSEHVLGGIHFLGVNRPQSADSGPFACISFPNMFDTIGLNLF